MFIGPNSSGKTSILQVLLLLKQTFESDEPIAPLILNGPHLELGEFKDFIHKGNTSLPFIVKFNFDENKKTNFCCKVCQKTFKSHTWFLNHIEKKHKKYWSEKQEEVRKSNRISREYSITLKYKYSDKTKSIILEQIEFTNPGDEQGVSLSSLKYMMKGTTNLVFEAVTYDNVSIIKKIIKKTKSIIQNPTKMVMNVQRTFLNDIYYYHYAYHTNKYNEQTILLKNDITPLLESIREKLTKTTGDKIQNPLLGYAYPKRLSLPEEEKIAIEAMVKIGYISNRASENLERLMDFIQSIRHVGPLRTKPERYYIGSGGRPTSVGRSGEHTQELIFRETQVGSEVLLQQINIWLKKLKMNCELEIVKLNVGDLYQINVKENNLDVNIADVGFGLSQILPILTQSIYLHNKIKEESKTESRVNIFGSIRRKHKTLLIIEQPEVHLNPKIQAQLADFFITLIKSDFLFFIETHSEHIISRLQRRVLDKTITNPKEVVIYYVNKTKENITNIEEISIKKNGNFSSWPQDFFQDDFDEAMELLKESFSSNPK